MRGRIVVSTGGEPGEERDEQVPYLTMDELGLPAKFGNSRLTTEVWTLVLLLDHVWKL